MKIRLSQELINAICYWGNNRANPEAALRTLRRYAQRERGYVLNLLNEGLKGEAKLALQMEFTPFIFNYAVEHAHVDDEGFYVEGDETLKQVIKRQTTNLTYPAYEYTVVFRPLYITYDGKRYHTEGYELIFPDYALPDFVFGTSTPLNERAAIQLPKETRIRLKQGKMGFESETLRGVDRRRLNYSVYSIGEFIKRGELQEIYR